MTPRRTCADSLRVLQSAEFLYETRLFPDSEYTFKHALTQEVAYGGLLTDRRRAIHARIVEAIERLQGDRLAEQVERLAHHALRAELWEKALLYGRQAGAKAMARWALRDAGTHLERALTATNHSSALDPRGHRAGDRRPPRSSQRHPLRSARSSGLWGSCARQSRSPSGWATRRGWERISLSLSISLWMMGHSDEAQDPGERALAIAESTDDAR